MPGVFIYIWDYRVSPENHAGFHQLYGASGRWVELFRRAPGYLDTQLLRDRNDATRFVTIDRWESEEAFRVFRERFASEFDELDRLGEGLTLRETPLGEFIPSEPM